MAKPVSREMSLSELVFRVRSAALRMSKRQPNRLLLLNAAAVLTSLGEQLETAWDELRDLKAERAAAKVIVLPGGGIERVN